MKICCSKICLRILGLALTVHLVKSEGRVSYLGTSTDVTECDVGSKLILHCNVSIDDDAQILWLKDGEPFTSNLSWNITNKLEIISNSVMVEDAGQYVCITGKENKLIELDTILVVKTSPGQLENVSVHATTVVALVHWHVSNDGGYPISHFNLIYCKDNSTNDSWHYPVPKHISPTSRQFFVYQLKPDTEYMFRIWATNQLGSGEATTIQATTLRPLNEDEVIKQMLHGDELEDFSSTAWMIAVSMVMGTVLILSCLSCLLIYKEGRSRSGLPEEDEDSQPHIITNPGFEIDLEESFLLEQADINFNSETTGRTNNNIAIRPSRV